MIRRAAAADAAVVSALASLLWEDADATALTKELSGLLEDDRCAIFLAVENGQEIGFAQCQLRHDYVEGTESSPVGYLEGIFVRPEHRGKGYARALLCACENWAAGRGCSEFASDCELSNADSLRFHLKVGFLEANRIICFTKKL